MNKEKMVQVEGVDGFIIGTVADTAEQAKILTVKGATIILNSVQGLLVSSAKGFIKE